MIDIIHHIIISLSAIIVYLALSCYFCCLLQWSLFLFFCCWEFFLPGFLEVGILFRKYGHHFFSWERPCLSLVHTLEAPVTMQRILRPFVNWNIKFLCVYESSDSKTIKEDILFISSSRAKADLSIINLLFNSFEHLTFLDSLRWWPGWLLGKATALALHHFLICRTLPSQGNQDTHFNELCILRS